MGSHSSRSSTDTSPSIWRRSKPTTTGWWSFVTKCGDIAASHGTPRNKPLQSDSRGVRPLLTPRPSHGDHPSPGSQEAVACLDQTLRCGELRPGYRRPQGDRAARLLPKGNRTHDLQSGDSGCASVLPRPRSRSRGRLLREGVHLLGAPATQSEVSQLRQRPNMRLKLAGAARSKGSGAIVLWRARTVVHPAYAN